jgi:hypothetical protein
MGDENLPAKSRKVVQRRERWYLVVVGLHGLWDASQSIAVWLTLWLTETPGQRLLIQLGQVPEVTQAQVHLYTAISWALLGLDGLIGLLVLHHLWRKATTLDRPATPVALPLVTGERGQ